MRKLDKEDTRLSVSSANTLRQCEQKWYHYKVANTPHDSDHDPGDNLMIGSAFHWLIEECEHKWPGKIVPLLKRYTAEEDDNFDKSYYPLLIGMVWSYTKYLESTDLEVLAIEHEIKDPTFVGYVDAIYEDSNGKWWISDNKTWKYFSHKDVAKEANHIQLNTYASFAKSIATYCGLALKDFGGCRLMVTTKPGYKQGKKSAKEYAEAMKEWSLTYDIVIPKKALNIDEHRDNHDELYFRSMELREEHNPVRNYNHCTSFFRPCEYWSQCHGSKYTDGNKLIEVRGG